MIKLYKKSDIFRFTLGYRHTYNLALLLCSVFRDYLEISSSMLVSVVITIIFSPVFVLTSEWVLTMATSIISLINVSKYPRPPSNREVRTFFNNSTPWGLSVSLSSEGLKNPVNLTIIKSFKI